MTAAAGALALVPGFFQGLPFHFTAERSGIRAFILSPGKTLPTVPAEHQGVIQLTTAVFFLVIHVDVHAPLTAAHGYSFLVFQLCSVERFYL